MDKKRYVEMSIDGNPNSEGTHFEGITLILDVYHEKCSFH